MTMELAGLNWLAVIVGTVVAFLAGWLWYSPKLFGTGWAEGSKVELGSAQSMPVVAMAAQLAALFLLALVVGITAVHNQLFTAIFAILALAAFSVSGGAFTRKSNYALMVDGGYAVVAGILMIVVQGIF
jgi:Protein of unknown function (DUF1761)